MRLARAPLGRQIADALRRDVLFGHLAPGTRLGQQQLCEEFGTSRMPVRDALRQLTYEGFLVTDEGQHSVVAKLSRRDLHDIYVIEGLLHGLATKRVTEQATEEELDELDRRHDEMLGAERASDVESMADLNWHFHRRINQLARSRKLVTALRALALSIPRDYVVEFPEWVHRANEEHADILAAMRDRDGDKAELLMRQHVTDAGADLLSYLESKGLDLE